MIEAQAEIIETFVKKNRQIEEYNVEQTAITYIASVAAGYPVSTSTDYDSGHTVINGIINKPMPRRTENNLV